ncbi:MAG: VOC family protein [Myxococcota bacterium]|jgi:hypothetical protein|nr:VOC family protein [Myxococcota bacterium]
MNAALLESRFGPIRQVAYVAEDIDAAMQAWNRQMGVGPFAVARDVTPFRGAKYRGESCEDLRLNLGFGYLGEIQLELIEQLDDRPSIYKEMLDRGNRGAHHYCFAVDDYGSAYRELMDSGFEVVVQAGNEKGGMIYCESSAIPGLILELIAWNERTRPYYEGTRKFLAGVDQGQLVHEITL